jgi:alginate O-acetyltransferase complex protein AlgI
MVFTSHLFLFYFLPLALGLYYAAPKSWRSGVLTLCSLFFYAWANPWFVPILLAIAGVDFVLANLIDGHWQLPWSNQTTIGDVSQRRCSDRGKRILVSISLICNIGVLFFFKYAMFVGDNLRLLIGENPSATDMAFVVLLPIGISFYTFESISYILDIHAGRARPASVWFHQQDRKMGKATSLLRSIRLEFQGFLTYVCYLTQFPHLVAGPIIRYQDLEPQLHDRRHTIDKFSRGVAFFILGLSKKILLANPIGEIADAAFSADGLQWYDAWYGVVAYAFQLYFDFSGYSDMAIGLALMVGFTFPKNFNAPYRAESLTDFWRRWHISLSTWLRDYVYIPLGGNRQGPRRAYRNLIIVMVIGGFWHGAEWTFLAWGAIHGVMLAGERLLGKTSPYHWLPRPGRIAVTFAVVCVAWVFFRSSTLSLALEYCTALIGFGTVRSETTLLYGLMYDSYHLTCMGVGALIIWGGMTTWDFTKHLHPLKIIACAVLLLASIAALCEQTFNPFLYFRF